jgi:hypothetical protein
MLYRRSYLCVVAAIALVVGCADNLPTNPTPTLTPASDLSAIGTKKHGASLTAPVDEVIASTHLIGTIQVTRFDQDDAGALLVSGVISGTADGVPFTQTFSRVPATLISQGSRGPDRTGSTRRASIVGPAPSASSSTALTTTGVSANQVATCDIVLLDLGPLHLDVLGLVVDLSQVVLNVDAVAGSGNLLGNLLCAVVHLLDGPAILAAVLNLLDQINAILGAL